MHAVDAANFILASSTCWEMYTTLPFVIRSKTFYRKKIKDKF
jgi:hypothetical protein